MSRLNDLEVNCAARRVLVRHWIDLGRVSLRTINGTLTVHGALDKMPHATTALAPSDVREIAADLQRIPNVQRLQMEFTNWIGKDGTLRRVSENPTANLLRQRDAPENGVYEINEGALPKSISELV